MGSPLELGHERKPSTKIVCFACSFLPWLGCKTAYYEISHFSFLFSRWPSRPDPLTLYQGKC